jgi:hypothetical protein
VIPIAPPPVTASAADSSARIQVQAPTALFTPIGSGSGSENAPVKGSVEGSEIGSGSGYELPELTNLQWELNAKGGWEVWHVPPGAVHRRNKTYLGYLGKRQLAAWQELTAAEFRQSIRAWVAQKRAAKL